MSSQGPSPRGEKGERGEPGETGLQGIQGIQGVQGIQGIPGPAGVDSGYVNPEGLVREPVRGPREEQGGRGRRGSRGDVGDRGPAGETGLSGERGPPGPPGTPGERGARGPIGDPGDRGPIGIGLQGDRGPVGPAGSAGDVAAFGTRLAVLEARLDAVEGSLAKTVEELRVSDVALKASEELQTALAGRLGRFKPLLEANTDALTELGGFWGSLKVGEIWLESSDEELSRIDNMLRELNKNMIQIS